MRQALTNQQYISYLDVSEYIIKEHSPAFKPLSPSSQQLSQILASLTPQIGPIDHDPSLLLTPITTGLIRHEIQQMVDEFILDGQNSHFFQKQAKKSKNKRQHYQPSDLELFRIESQLEDVLEEYYEEDFQSSSSEQEEAESEMEECYAHSNTIMTAWTNRLQSKDSNIRESQQDFQIAIDLINIEFLQKIERFRKNPRMEIAKKLKEIDAQEIDQRQKRIIAKTFLEKFLVDHEEEYFEDQWSLLPTTFKETVTTINRGISQTFSKKIGPLSYEARRVKLLTYLQKKQGQINCRKRRIWKKKVSYDCRKRVADGRLRIKGKFVTRQQVCQQLGFDSLENYSLQEIKQMLQKRMDDQMIHQVTC